MKTNLILAVFMSVILYSCNKEEVTAPDYRDSFCGAWHFTHHDVHNEWDMQNGGFTTTDDVTDYPNGVIQKGDQPNTLMVSFDGFSFNTYEVQPDGTFPNPPGTNPSFPEGGSVSDTSFHYDHGGIGGTWGTSYSYTDGVR